MKAAIMRERATTAMDLRMKSSLCRADRMDRRWLDFSPDFGDTDPRPEGFNRVSRVPWQGYDNALAPERSPATSPTPAARRLRGPLSDRGRPEASRPRVRFLALAPDQNEEGRF